MELYNISEKWFGYFDKDAVTKVFTSYIFSDLIYNGTQWHFYMSKTPILVFSMNLLNEDHIICNATGYGNCVYSEKNRIILTNNNYNVLKNYINDRIETFRRMHPKIKNDSYTFKNSHEILFDDVDLKYLVAIISPKETYNKVIDLVKKYNLNVKIIKYSNNYKKIFDLF